MLSADLFLFLFYLWWTWHFYAISWTSCRIVQCCIVIVIIIIFNTKWFSFLSLLVVINIAWLLCCFIWFFLCNISQFLMIIWYLIASCICVLWFILHHVWEIKLVYLGLELWQDLSIVVNYVVCKRLWNKIFDSL